MAGPDTHLRYNLLFRAVRAFIARARGEPVVGVLVIAKAISHKDAQDEDECPCDHEYLACDRMIAAR